MCAGVFRVQLVCQSRVAPLQMSYSKGYVFAPRVHNWSYLWLCLYSKSIELDTSLVMSLLQGYMISPIFGHVSIPRV